MKRKTLQLFSIMLLMFILTTTVFADDGTVFKRNVSGTPNEETEHAAIKMLPVYVPAQASDGTVLVDGIDIYDADGTIVETRTSVQPLIVHYNDGHVETIDEDGYGGFPGHGERDAFAGVSLDGGATWKTTNLSNSADRSSFKISLGGRQKIAYPGDVGRSFMASDGNQVLIVWVSRFAGGGNPNYAMSDEERSLVADYMVGTGAIPDASACTDGDLIGTPCLYLEDHFSVAGSQGSSNLADEGYPLVGELPYAALWAARGVIMPPVAEGEPSTFVWFKAERLSSAVRDANRPEASCVKGAGCVVTWQEDPDGIRPGSGDGPGEGWSGAIAHHQTDTWYSYIDWQDFNLVSEDGTYGSLLNDTGDLAEWIAANDTGSPSAAIPMSIPVRLTDNSMCVAADDKPYCYVDFDNSGTADFCASSAIVSIEVPDEDGQAVPHDVDMCITEDGRLMRGNTASTRARLGLNGYSSLGDYRIDPSAYPIDSAWFTVSYEENKGLGDEGEDEIVPEDLIDKVDMGKNVWYHTFDMFNPELVSQGLMLNQPAVYPENFANPENFLTQEASLGYNFYTIDPDPIYEVQGGLETTLYQTEISRRPSKITQDWYDAGETGTVAFQLWKQGIIRRGGPADIMGRRFVIPDEFDAATDNPYDYTNMVCDTWAYTDGSNPRYVKGFCADPAINLSGNTILTSETCGDAAGCLDVYPFNDYYDDLDMTDQTDGVSKIYTWEMTGPGYGDDPSSFVGTDINADATNLNDTSWANPYDMAKGHRGFLVGDNLMVMYGWTPNWNDLANGHSIVNLYVRRSFDGGQTWSTTPASFTHTNGITYSGDGTTTCEWMGPISEQVPVCVDYGAGDFEQARNVSQLGGSQVTVLDPRYSPTTRSITEASVSSESLPAGFSAPLYDDDTRDPSRFFMVYETGETSAYDAGEATPLDLFYSRAIEWGDEYLVWQDEATADCLPAADTEDEFDLAGFCNEFDALEGSQFDESGEASVTTNPGGTFFYTTWNQIDFDHDGNEILSDAIFRRVLFIDDYNPLLDISLTIEINSPDDGAMFVSGSEINFSGTADDLVDGNLSQYIEWDSNIDGDIGIGESISTLLSDGEHTITASVMDNDGNIVKTKIVIIVSPDEGPVVEIDSPDDGAMFVSGSEIDFSGTADDLEDGDLSNTIAWEDNGVPLGTAGSFSAVLSDGAHTITASVTDNDGNVANTSIDITVYPLPGSVPVVVIDKPDDNESVEAFTEISFYATADDLEDGALNSDIVWASDIDGVIGTGASIKTVLSGPVGEDTTNVVHSITASVTDSDGNLGSVAIVITIVPKPNEAPIVEIIRPDDGAMFVSGSEIDFSGTADDLEDGSLSSEIVWASDLEGEIGTGTNFNAVLIDGVHTITASVTDQYGLTTTASIEITVYPLPGYDPNIVIDTPATGTTFDWGTKIFFNATADDLEDGVLSTEIEWESSIDGVIGTGPSINVVLSGPDGAEPVVHTITASVLDSDGNPANTSIDLTINPNTAPTILINAPAAGADFVYGTAIEFSATADDLEDGSLSSEIEWISDLDGVIGTGDSFITTELSVGSHTITASVVDAGELEAYDVVSITVSNEPNNQALTVDVTTIDPYYYSQRDTVQITATVTDQNGNPVEAAEVTVVIEFYSLTISRTAETDADGIAVVTYKINTRKTGIGVATVTVTATKPGYADGIDDTAVFEVVR